MAGRGRAFRVSATESLAEKYRRQEKLRRELDAAFLSIDSKDEALMPENDYYEEHGVDSGARLSDRLLGSPQFKSWYKQVAPSGTISENARGLTSPPIEYKAGLKTLLTGASNTSAGAMVFPDTKPFVGPPGRHELTLRDLITVVPTDSDTVEFAKFNTETNSAAIVPEATSLTDDGALKPQSGMDFVVVSVAIKNLAHWIPVARRCYGRFRPAARVNRRVVNRGIG